MTKTAILESKIGTIIAEHRMGITIVKLAVKYNCGASLIKRVFKRHGIIPAPSRIQKGKPLLDPNSKEWKDACIRLSVINKGKGHPQSIETRKKISETRKARGLKGGYKPGSGRGIKSWYDSPIAGKVFMDSTYEVRYAQYLDFNKIVWKKNKERFPYTWMGETKYYIPDFYLTETDEYIEIKGFKRENDQAKWDAFPKKLRVIFGEELQSLTK